MKLTSGKKRCNLLFVKKQIQDLDLFATRIEFTFDGEKRISSIPGFFITVILASILLAFGIQRLIFYSQSIPTAYSYTDNQVTANLTKIGFKIAFAVESQVEKIGLDDASFVRWEAKITQKTKNTTTVTPLNIHKCDTHDYDSFYPPSPVYAYEI
jgi:hypothetical protein